MNNKAPAVSLDLDALLDEQSACWDAGAPVAVEEYLTRHPGLGDDALLRLLYHEVLLRRQRGEAPRAEDYRARFPHLADRLTLLFEMDDVFLHDDAATVIDGIPLSDPIRPEVSGYEVLGELGRGGMGVVYQARQQGAERVVALKMLRSGSAAGPEERARFQREMAALGRLSHPHIVPIYEVGEQAGEPYFSMEFAAGGTLADRLRAALPDARGAAALVEPLSRAAHAAHAAGIVHRDLKPSNVLLTADGTPKLSDFGLARRVDATAGLTGSAALLGTPEYMAPEQAGGARAASAAADVYALGAILYECLTGRPPFCGATALETLEQVRSRDPIAPRRLRPEVPRDLEAICRKCLEKEPRHRYATAADLADDLSRFLNHRQVRARAPSVVRRAIRPLRRRPLVAALAAVVVACGFLLLGWAFTLDRLNDEQIQRACLDYRQAVAAADDAYHHDNNAIARAHLERVRPARGAFDPRTWEWYLYWRRTAPDSVAPRPTPDDYLPADRVLPAGEVAFLPTALAFTEGSRCLAVSSAHFVRIHDLETGQIRDEPGGHEPSASPRATAFAANGATVASLDADGRLSLRDGATGDAFVFAEKTRDPWGLAFSPDGRTLLTTSKDDRGICFLLTFYDVNLRCARYGLPMRHDLRVLAYSPDGRWLAGAAADGTCYLWEAATAADASRAAVRRSLHRGQRAAALFSPGGGVG